MKIVTRIVKLAVALAVPHAMAATAQGMAQQLMPSAKVDLAKDTATLPLHMGTLKDGRKVYFVLTDTTDAKEAARLGLVHAAQLSAVATAKSTRSAEIDSKGMFVFDSGTVDFKPVQQLVPGSAPDYFPPKSASPGSVGDANYSPFVKIQSTGVIYNAPIVAFDVEPSQISFCNGKVDYNLVHDRVSSICPQTMEVSIRLGHGFAGGASVIYLSFDSNNMLPATMESSTYTPATADLVNTGASETLYGFANGATGVNNPDRQGFDSALAGEGPPLNILGGLTTTSSGYTPLWDVNVAVWTSAAIAKGERHRLMNGSDAEMNSQAGLLTNPMGAKVGSLGLLVNCPVIGFIK